MIRVCFVLCVISFAGCKESTPAQNAPVAKESKTPPKNTPTGKETVAPFVPESIIDRVKFRRDYYVKELNLAQLPYGNRYVAEYFDKLKIRKEEAKAWSLKTHPKLIFIGYAHASLASGVDPNDLSEVNIQNRIYSALVHNMQTTDLITFEDSGSDDPVTIGEMVRAQTQTFAEYLKYFTQFEMPAPQKIREMVVENQNGVLRFMREYESPTVYFGEEWPCVLQSILTFTFEGNAPDKKPIVSNFLEDLTHLRSEILVIRTLEFLRRRLADKAIMVQGIKHADDMSALATEYGFRLQQLLYTY